MEYVKVYLNQEQLKILDEMRGESPKSKALRDCLLLCWKATTTPIEEIDEYLRERGILR